MTTQGSQTAQQTEDSPNIELVLRQAARISALGDAAQKDEDTIGRLKETANTALSLLSALSFACASALFLATVEKVRAERVGPSLVTGFFCLAMTAVTMWAYHKSSRVAFEKKA